METQKAVKGVNLLFLALVMVAIVFEIVIGILSGLGIDIFMGKVTLQLVYSQLIFAVPAIIYFICSNRDKKKGFEFLRFKKIRFSNILLCILIYICLTPVLNFFNSLSMLYSTNVISSVMFSVTDEVPFVVGILIIAILPAFLEEFTYRGIFYNTYRPTAGFGAALLSGLLFGLVHGNLNQFTYAFVLGVIFALIVEATDSIWSTMIVHALVNAVSVVTIYGLPAALNWMQNLYDTAKAENDINTMALIERIMGTDDFSVEAFMGTAADSLTTADILLIIRGYLIPAIVGGILVFLLLRLIAKRCGRWEIMCSMFGAGQPKPLAAEREVITHAEDGTFLAEPVYAQVPLEPAPVSRVKLITWELIAAGVVQVLMMIATELLLRYGDELMALLK